MTNTNPTFKGTLKILALSACAAATALSAQASRLNNTFDVTFEFSRAQSVQDIYTTFEAVADAACRSETDIGLTNAPMNAARKCKAELMEKVVKKAGIPALTELHRAKAQPAG